MGGGFCLTRLPQERFPLYAVRHLFGLFTKALRLLVETIGERQNVSESASLHGFHSMAVNRELERGSGDLVPLIPVAEHRSLPVSQIPAENTNLRLSGLLFITNKFVPARGRGNAAPLDSGTRGWRSFKLGPPHLSRFLAALDRFSCFTVSDQIPKLMISGGCCRLD
jgi:hypothetical protein